MVVLSIHLYDVHNSVWRPVPAINEFSRGRRRTMEIQTDRQRHRNPRSCAFGPQSAAFSYQPKSTLFCVFFFSSFRSQRFSGYLCVTLPFLCVAPAAAKYSGARRFHPAGNSQRILFSIIDLFA